MCIDRTEWDNDDKKQASKKKNKEYMVLFKRNLKWTKIIFSVFTMNKSIKIKSYMYTLLIDREFNKQHALHTTNEKLNILH